MQIKSVKADEGTFKVESAEGDVFAFQASTASDRTLDLLGSPKWSGGAEPTDAEQRIEASHKAALELASTLPTSGSSGSE